MGVAHGDISFNNLMYDKRNGRGILNDFDLASIMEPGDKSPKQTGHRRTVILSFMAMKLLSPDGLRGDIPRLYRHEFESFVWVLLWASLHEEEDHAKHIRGWGMYNQKSSFLRDLDKNLNNLHQSPISARCTTPFNVVLKRPLEFDSTPIAVSLSLCQKKRGGPEGGLHQIFLHLAAKLSCGPSSPRNPIGRGYGN